MNGLMIALSMGCLRVSAPPEDATNVVAIEVPSPPAPACKDGSPASAAEVRMGRHTLTTYRCVRDGETVLVEARMGPDARRWIPADDETEHAFSWVGKGKDGQGFMVLRYRACPMGHCERATFFSVSADGTVTPLGQPTTAHAWAVTDGRLLIKVKTGFNPDYSIASATQTLAWNGQAFAPEGKPTAKAEYDSWICEDTTVAVVDPQTGKPTGQTVPVGQDDAITVLQAGEPVGTVFEYRVNGTTFWASGWEQTCAG